MSLREKYDNFVIRHTPTCHEAVEIHSAALDESVSPLKRALVWWHSNSCIYCKRYFQQLERLQAWARENFRRQTSESKDSALVERTRSAVRDRLTKLQ